MSRSKLRLFLWRWHRRLGIAIFVLILLLSVTGILLNHSGQVGLADKPVRQGWLLSLYGLKAPTITSFAVGEHWLSHLGGDYLYLDGRELAYCAHQLTGALVNNGIWVAACRDELLLLTPQGDVIERIGGAYGLPKPISGLGRCDQQLCLGSGSRWYLADIDQLTWQPIRWQQLETAQPASLPARVKQLLRDSYYGSTITWERVMLDLHSGRLFQMGPWFMDLVGMLLMALSVTGLTMWYSGQRRSRKKARR